MSPPSNSHKGDVLFLTSRDLQAIQGGGRGKIVGFESLGTQPIRFFELDAAAGLNGREQLEIFYTQVATSLTKCWRACHEIHSLLSSAQKRSADTSGDVEAALKSIIRLAVIEATKVLPVFRDFITPPVERTNLARAVRAEAYVTASIERDIRKNEIADFLGVSISQLTLAFREVGQLAVRDRLRFRRIESARHLLADSPLSVSEVAEKVGMNYRHFIRAFRQSTDLTPLRYRKYARSDSKTDLAWNEFFHTVNFEIVEPDPELSSHLPDQLPPINDGAITVLISNGSDQSITVSRLGQDGVYAKLATVCAEKRASFTDVPGSTWKLSSKDGTESNESFFQTSKTNAHLIYKAAQS